MIVTDAAAIISPIICPSTRSVVEKPAALLMPPTPRMALSALMPRLVGNPTGPIVACESADEVRVAD
jgi:hypothetical protein